MYAVALFFMLLFYISLDGTRECAFGMNCGALQNFTRKNDDDDDNDNNETYRSICKMNDNMLLLCMFAREWHVTRALFMGTSRNIFYSKISYSKCSVLRLQPFCIIVILIVCLSLFFGFFIVLLLMYHHKQCGSLFQCDSFSWKTKCVLQESFLLLGLLINSICSW